MTDADIITNFHMSQIVDPYILSKPAIIPNFQEPWIFYIYARFDCYIPPDFCTK